MIYLDNSATTKPYREVLESFNKVSTEYFGNPSSLHGLGGDAEKLLSQAREQIAKLLKAQAKEILFTSGGTESNNIAIKGTALMYRGRGRHIITTEIEHPSVKESMEQLKALGFRITYIPVDSNGTVSVTDIEKAISQETILVSVMHVNNETGSIQPIKEIGQLIKQYSKIIFHVDYVQGIGKVPLQFHDCQIDLCTFSGHKFHGLKGTGALFVRQGVKISPLFSGGGQEWQQRSGTENVAGIVAMAKALRLTLLNQENSVAEMKKIRDFIRLELEKIDGIKIHTPVLHCAPHIINFSIHGFKAEVFVHALEEKGIYVSTTSACSSKIKKASSTLLAMGVPEEEALSSIRVSLSYENTMEEAIQFIETVNEAINRLRKVMN
ncbi:cysteine desulfurase family protein [Cytobacillus solani]|uniref:Cysteine desulfurase n=1 Tax=Cytobacillus solani TaxID=1637975 RepID=A0A0Q3TCA1_9BACI|nr:cysteine desulfurase family protein [Cytobacillus solani]KQL20821.1 cysteine desulfurase [Cytobacillus solani]USK54061.1 cysteine desulfurase [Cytobacillus solani]